MAAPSSSSSVVAALVLFLWTRIIFLSYTLPVATSVPSQSLTEATQVLSNSGFVSMSLTLHLLSKPLALSSSLLPSLTVFSPSDASFSLSSQPSLSLLRLHLVPRSLPFDSLHSLPFGTKIPTLDPNVSLVVTTPFPGDYSCKIRLNGVQVIGSPVFDDGLLTIYGVEDFLDPNFDVPPSAPAPSPAARGGGCKVDADASSVHLTRQLRHSGHSLAASFLGMQIGGLKNQKITVFSPGDDALANLTGSIGEVASVLLRHVLPCRITGREFGGFRNRTVIGTNLEGSPIVVTVSGEDKHLMVNGVVVKALDMFESEWISVHGLNGVLPENPDRDNRQ